MTIKGSVRGGVVVLPEGVKLPEGQEVDIYLPAEGSTELQSANTDTGRRLINLAGSCEGLPEDLSVNVDHYLYGAPKR